MQDELLDAIDTFYDCIDDEFDYERALAVYSKMIGNAGVMIADINPISNRYDKHFAHNVHPDAVKAWTNADPRYGKCSARNKLMRTLPFLPVYTPVVRQAYVSDEEWENSTTNQVAFKPWGYHGFVGSIYNKSLLSVTYLGFSYENHQPSADAVTLSLATIMNRHLHRAMSVQSRVDRLEEALIQSSNVLDLIEFGLVLYDASRKPVFVNAAAHRIFDAKDGLALKTDEISIGHRSTARKFEQLLHGIFDPAGPIRTQAGGIMKIPRASLGRAYSIMLVPMRINKLSTEKVTCCLFIFDPSSRRKAAIDLFVSSYGLTKTEAQLAHSLILGDSLDQAAAKRNVSRNTAKSHLHSIFTKTDTKRQAELISLLLRSVAGIGLMSSRD